MVGAEEKEVI